MRLLKRDESGNLTLTVDLTDQIPAYAILSHTWGKDHEEVTFDDIQNGQGRDKPGYAKLQFCGEQAAKEKLEHFWVDTCSINKANLSELDEAIRSMFRWYEKATTCCVYLSDVSVGNDSGDQPQQEWESAFRNSRWFKRGWTLQELLAPKSVEFFSREGTALGNKITLKRIIHEITGISILALEGMAMSQFSVEERLRWAEKRETKKAEDRAYCLWGIFSVFLPVMYGEGGNAFKRLREAIAKQSSDSSHPSLDTTSTPTHWLVSQPCNGLFTGREDILQEAEAVIREAVADATHSQQYRIVISGMGGQGKSEICLQLARRVCHLLWGVFWVDVSNQTLAEAGYLKISTALGAPAETLEDAKLTLSNVKHSWLLVLDNADNPEFDYQQYIPTGLLGVVVLTSRNEECHDYATVAPIVLGGLAEKEAQDLLFKAARVPLDQRAMLQDDARVVARLLQYHPLALIQAGAYVSRRYCTLAEYPCVFDQHRQRLMGFKPKQARSRYRDVYATFEASAELLQQAARKKLPEVASGGVANETAQDALDILPLLAVCSPSQFPVSQVFDAAWKGAKSVPLDMNHDAEDEAVMLLTPWHVEHVPLFLNIIGDSWDSFRVDEAVQLLKSLSLVSVDHQGGCMNVSMHPLIHAWARDRQDRTHQHDSWLRMGCIIAFSTPDFESWVRYKQQLQSHVETLVAWDMDIIFGQEPIVLVSRILMRCGWGLYYMCANGKLFELVRIIFNHVGLKQDVVQSGWTGVYDLSGRNLLNHGMTKEALELLGKVAKIRVQTLDEEHPDRLRSQHELAVAYQANGQVNEAVNLLQKVVKIQEQILKADHPDRLDSQHALAMAYRANGQVNEAVNLLQKVVKIQEQTLNEEHPDQLASQHELAVAYRAARQVNKAAELLEKVVKIEKQILKEDHPDRLASQHELAVAYRATGQVNKAVELLEKVVKIEKQILKEDHPDRLASQHELAVAYQANGQVNEAVNLLQKVVKIQEQILKADHPDQLDSQHALAMAYRANGQVNEAVNLLQKVVKIREQTLDEEHPDRLASQHELAVAYRAAGQVNKAAELLEKVVKIEKQILKEDHPDRLASQHELAVAYRATGQVNKAAELLEKVVKIEEQILKEDHPDRLTSLNNLAVYRWKLGKREIARNMMDQVVTISRRALDETHPDRRRSERWLERMEDKLAQRERV